MVYTILVIILFICINIYFLLAKKFNIIDKPNHRSSHKRITLRGGGVVFYFGVLFCFFWSGFQYPFFFFGLTGICLVSFVDDLKEMPRRIRLLVQFISMLLLLYQIGLFDFDWWILLIALILTTGIINAYNFMDGINGITGGYSLVVLVGLYWVNTQQVNFADQDLILSSLLSVVVFNFYNFRKKAKCFAGDVGSVGIAFIILFLLRRLILISQNPCYILFLGVYGVDSVLTIVHRLLLKENILQPHRKHLYQLMANELRIPHTQVAIIYMLIQAIVIIGFLQFKTSIIDQVFYFVLVMVLLSGVYLLMMRKYFYLHLKKVM